MQTAPDVLTSLKDFQRATVEYAFDRLWTSEDRVKHFLVADEVGLGKTMVAKGVIAKAVDHLRAEQDRITVVYICSNGQIARQNLRRLNVVGGHEVRHADRLSLLPRAMHQMADAQVNFVSFTPGTSFHVTRGGGRCEERTMLLHMLNVASDADLDQDDAWLRFFQGRMRYDRFKERLGWALEDEIDHDLCRALRDQLEAESDDNGITQWSALERCVQDFRDLEPSEAPVTGNLGWRRDQLIGRMRHLIATAAVARLQPDIVVLDEFQRFKDLVDTTGDNPAQQLAKAVFADDRTKVLLLSATPYKMYTLPDEADGEDHYRDFVRTVRFLSGEDRAAGVEQELKVIRRSLTSGADRAAAESARAFVENELRRVMARTERLTSTPAGDGMVVEKQFDGGGLRREDVLAWQTLERVAGHLKTNDPFEYWRSAPYALNLMDRNGYQIRKQFHAALTSDDVALAKVVDGASGLLEWDDIKQYQVVNPGNAKLRGLQADFINSGAWKAVWLPPSLPYYDLAGIYGDEQHLAGFTKRLIFSAWNVVPKAIAVLLSYEAERQAMTASAAKHEEMLDYTKAATRPLQWKLTSDEHSRPASLPVLSLLYPHTVLADIGDPLLVAREHAGADPALRMSADELRTIVEGRVREKLAELPHGDPARPTRAAEWYLAAPVLLDQAAGADTAATAHRLRRVVTGRDDDETSIAAQHLAAIVDLDVNSLGPAPEDLAEVLTDMAIAAPGVCALRALGRVTEPDEESPADSAMDAFRISLGLRAAFNKPEIYALARGVDSTSDPGYWRRVLDHCIDGCLQAVLDEYAHVLLESEGLQDAAAAARSDRISEVMSEALSTRSATNPVDFVHVHGGTAVMDTHGVSSHVAARYGHAQTTDQTVQRESSIRVAFNSPFRPFVLASTSAGQEGLDFHTYSHAVVHWNLPTNPVDLEQREGRVHRYKGHAVRKNVAFTHGAHAFTSDARDPWEAVFAAAAQDRPEGSSDLVPYWVYAPDGGARIERYVPAEPFSREMRQYERLQRTVGAYRMVIGQPRQSDLIRYVGDDVDWLRIDLSPPADKGLHGHRSESARPVDGSDTSTRS